jgi:predicted DNA-binding transcriptional regulator YafY
MRASRLLSILMLLQARGGLSASALATELEVSVRTILRDVDQLSAAGVPVWAERGREGGFRLQPGWSTQLTGLTGDEAQALQLAGLPQAATELGLGEAATSARLKMLAALPEALRGDAERLRQRLHIDPVDWYRAATAPPHLQAVARAVWNECVISIRYASWQHTRNNTVKPLGLVLKAGVWYVMALPEAASNKPEPRIYRLDRIESLEVQLNRRFKPPKNFDLAAQWKQATEQFEASLYCGHALLRVSEQGLRWVGEASAKVQTAARASAQPEPARGVQAAAEGRWFRIHIPMESVEQAARQYLALGHHAEVLGPPALREQMAQLSLQVAALYGANTTARNKAVELKRRPAAGAAPKPRAR